MFLSLKLPNKQNSVSKVSNGGRSTSQMRLIGRLLALTTGGLILSAPLRAEDNGGSKGLLREQQKPQASQPSAPESTPSPPLSGAAVLNKFPDPNLELSPADVDTVEQPAAATSNDKLSAIIGKAAPTEWERLTKLGNDAFSQALYADAEKTYMASIRELKKTNLKDERLAKSRNNLGSAYLREGKYQDAKEAFQLADTTIRELGKTESLEEARALTGLAAVNKQTGQMSKAEELLKSALKIRQKAEGADSQGVAQCLLDLADLYRKQKLFSEADPVYQLSLETLNKAPDVAELSKAYFLDRTGQFFQDQGKMPEAKRCFEASLTIKDKFSVMYTPVNPRKRGLVYYRCLTGAPNAAKVLNRGVEIEALYVKDVTCVATLATQVLGRDWALLKGEVTLLNRGKTAISALPEQPALFLEIPREQVLTPLSSEAIATELGARGRLLADRIMHSADFAFMLENHTVSTTTVAPVGPVFNTITNWTSVTPDWQARARARNEAIMALSGTLSEGQSVVRTKPAETTIGPGETATFDIFFPYKRFEAATLRFLVGNTVLEFPFGEKG